MTTTAHEDQYLAAPEPVRQPYDTVAILKRNVASIEVALKQQTERAEAAEAELAKLAQQKPVAWRPVVGFDGLYEVSSEGDIRNAQTGNIAAKHLMGDGYVKADLWKRGKRKQTSAHRVVAEAFIGPIDGLEINHRNGVKTDNRVANLEITTRSENVNHSYYELGNIIKPIVATNTTSGQSTEYRSIEEAVREGGFRSSSIYDCLNGKVKTHSGHSFSRPAAPVPAPAVPAEWRAVMAELLANDGADGGRYDANKWLAARDKARALLQSAEVAK